TPRGRGREASAEDASADVAAGGGQLSELVQKVHRLEIGLNLTGCPEAARANCEHEPEHPSNQVVAGLLQRPALAARQLTKLEAHASSGFREGPRERGAW